MNLVYLVTAAVVGLAVVPAASLGLVLPVSAVVATVAGPVGGNTHLPVPTVELCLRVAAGHRLSSYSIKNIFR